MRDAPESAATSYRPPGAVVTALCLVQFVDVLGVTAATTAIPAIVHDLRGDSSSAALLGSVYAASFGALLVPAARAGDRYGHRRVLLTGIVAFGLVGVLAAFSRDVRLVVLARALQGAAAAVSVPSALRILLAAAPLDPARRTAVGMWSAAGAVAGACGFLAGGVLTQTAGWQAVFWISGPVAAVLLLLLVPLTAVAAAGGDRDQRLGILGGGMLGAAVGGVVLGAALVEGPSTRLAGAALIGAGAVLGALLVLQQRRADVPLLPAGGLRDANLRTGVLASFVNTATTSSVAVLATLQLQSVLGLPPVVAGLALLPISAGAVGGSLAAPWIGARLAPRRAAAAGLGGIVIGDAAFAVTVPSLGWTVVAAVIIGLGLGAASVPATAIGTAVPAALVGGATGVVNTAAQLGTALGTAVLVVLAGVIGRFGVPTAAAAAALLAAGTAVRLVVQRPPAAPAAAG
ncbi:MFS transporter [Amnibacterium sp. CER49]|uniref:MFS transporter n=1 Tax=Amnibacterium sp. CER49 TaxID=3039161 RepID=UPI00244974D9|nr:MFS transporter [Amnibacterium sp. CER49]MDH2442668.1 MFS transporter [Amnibacterium sp. CER49]